MIKPRHFVRRVSNGIGLIFFRIFLSFIVFLLILSSRNNLALYLFVLTAIVSFLDGFIAKKYKIVSQFRSIFDPFADKLLVNLTAISLSLKGLFPFWVTGVFLVKDLLIVIGALLILIRKPKIVFRSNFVDRISVFVQLLTLFFVLLERLDYVLITISLLLVGLSFVISLFRSGVRITRYRSEFEEIRFLKLIKLPDFFTFFNILAGMFSIIFSINSRYYLSIFMLLIAVLFDYLDGKVARLIRRKGDFGKQLDSLADTISFGVAPAIFGFSLIQTRLAVIMFALFIFAGVLRLARYNVMEFTGDYAGMPITINGLVVPFIYLIKVPFSAYPYIYLFLAMLMVSPIKVKKLF